MLDLKYLMEKRGISSSNRRLKGIKFNSSSLPHYLTTCKLYAEYPTVTYTLQGCLVNNLECNTLKHFDILNHYTK